MKEYKTQKTNSLFYGNLSIVEAEINTSNTVSFMNLIDLTNVEASRANFGAGSRPSYTAYLAKVIAQALQEYPYANRRFYRPLGFLPRRFQIFSNVDIAIASETNIEGVEYIAFLDILRDVEKKSLLETKEWLQNFRSTTNENEQLKKLTTIMTRVPKFLSSLLIRLPVYIPSWWVKYRGGAVLISSPAKYGVDAVVGSWPAPIGISFGLVKDRVIVKNGKPTICPSFYLTMNFDRRLMVGAPAARFFARISELVENFEKAEIKKTFSQREL